MKNAVAGDCLQISTEEDSLDLSLPPWPFTPLPEVSPVDSDESFVIPSLPPWPFTPYCNDSGSIVEETPGIWDSEAGSVPKTGDLKVGSEGCDGELEAGAEGAQADSEMEDEELVRIAKLQGWDGSMSPLTLQILKSLLPLYFKM